LPTIKVFHTSDWEANPRQGSLRKANWSALVLQREKLCGKLRSMIDKIAERTPDLLLLSGDLFEGTALRGGSKEEEERLMKPTRDLYMDCILRPLKRLASSTEIIWTFGSHDCRAWSALPGWEFWQEFPGRMYSVPYGELARETRPRKAGVTVVAFGGLDATKNDQLWPEGTEPWKRPGARPRQKTARTGKWHYEKGIAAWSEELSAARGPLIAVSPTRSLSGLLDKGPFCYVALGGLQEVNPSFHYRVIRNGIKGAQGCPFRIKDGNLVASPIAETLISCDHQGKPLEVEVNLVHPETFDTWPGTEGRFVWRSRAGAGDVTAPVAYK
jgi:hypothetical protein